MNTRPFRMEAKMTKSFQRITATENAEVERPSADKLISGDPEFTTWNIEDVDGLYCGTWRSTPGKWKIQYDEWEYCHILEGHSIISEDGGDTSEVRAGDSFVIRPGFSGTWEVVETTTKEYVIRL